MEAFLDKPTFGRKLTTTEPYLFTWLTIVRQREISCQATIWWPSFATFEFRSTAYPDATLSTFICRCRSVIWLLVQLWDDLAVGLPFSRTRQTRNLQNGTRASRVLIWNLFKVCKFDTLSDKTQQSIIVGRTFEPSFVVSGRKIFPRESEQLEKESLQRITTNLVSPVTRTNIHHALFFTREITHQRGWCDSFSLILIA